jgi:hypothetical protein
MSDQRTIDVPGGRMLRRWCVALGALGVVTHPAVVAAPADCPGGLLGVAAQIVSVQPEGAALMRTTAENQKVQAVAGQHLCHGESVAVPPAGQPVSAVLHVGGQRRVLERGQSFAAAAASAALNAQAVALLDSLQLPDGGLRIAPDVPEPRLVRSAGEGATGPALQLTTLRTLRSLPRQALTGDVAPVLAWREGVGPYTCNIVSVQGDVITSRSADERSSWCALPAGQTNATQLLVRESRGPSVTWNVRWVDWADVPRPPTLPSLSPTASAADRAAWALWLWREAPPAWRLQGLAMLHQLAPQAWLAGYARDLILADQWVQTGR